MKYASAREQLTTRLGVEAIGNMLASIEEVEGLFSITSLCKLLSPLVFENIDLEGRLSAWMLRDDVFG